MAYRKGYFKKDGTYVKGHYVTPKTKTRKLKPAKGGCVLVFFIVLGLSALFSCTDSTGDDCISKSCSDFSTQAEAQSTLNNNLNCYKNLDAGNDGIACENLTN